MSKQLFEKVINSKGQGLIEYSLIILLIGLAVIIALTPIGGEVVSIFNKITAGF